MFYVKHEFLSDVLVSLGAKHGLRFIKIVLEGTSLCVINRALTRGYFIVMIMVIICRFIMIIGRLRRTVMIVLKYRLIFWIRDIGCRPRPNHFFLRLTAKYRFLSRMPFYLIIFLHFLFTLFPPTILIELWLKVEYQGLLTEIPLWSLIILLTYLMSFE